MGLEVQRPETEEEPTAVLLFECSGEMLVKAPTREPQWGGMQPSLTHRDITEETCLIQGQLVHPSCGLLLT